MTYPKHHGHHPAPHQYQGVHRAVVVDNQDPEQRLRLRLRVPSITAMAITGWAWPCVGTGGSEAPAVGSGVWVMYEGGDLDYPVWMGVFEPSSDAIPGERRTAIYTTGPLSLGATETGVITMSSGYRVLRIETSVPARVRLYTTFADRDGDISRSITTDPAPGLGIVMDYVTASMLLVAPMAPVPVGAVLEDPPTAAVPISVTSVDGGPVVVTLTWVSE